jgi:hypothetical protein
MRLNLMANGRFLSVLPSTLLRHPSNKAWLRALKVDLGDSTGPISAITIRDRRSSGAVKLFLEVSRAVCKELRNRALSNAEDTRHVDRCAGQLVRELAALNHAFRQAPAPVVAAADSWCECGRRTRICR